MLNFSDMWNELDWLTFSKIPSIGNAGLAGDSCYGCILISISSILSGKMLDKDL